MRTRIHLGDVMLYVDLEGRDPMFSRLIKPHRCLKPNQVPSADGFYDYVTLLELNNYYACRHAAWSSRLWHRMTQLKYIRRHMIQSWWRRHTVHRWQRMCRGWSDRDAWHIDIHVACMLHDMLRYHKDHAYTFVDINADGQRCTATQVYDDPDSGCDRSDRWDAIIEEMILGFGHVCRAFTDEPDITNPEHIMWQTQIDRAYALYATWHNSLWD